MFGKKSKIALYSIALTGFVIWNGNAMAQVVKPSGGIAASNRWQQDDHDYKRAIGFGSIQLATGSDTDTWHEINAHSFCEEQPYPIPEPTSPDTPNSTLDASTTTPTSSGRPSPKSLLADDGLTCWEVLVTTAFSVANCPDGRPIILRSGVGVSLKDRHSGEPFAWQEAYACVQTSDTGAQIPESSSNGSPAVRPFNYNLIKKQ